MECEDKVEAKVGHIVEVVIESEALARFISFTGVLGRIIEIDDRSGCVLIDSNLGVCENTRKDVREWFFAHEVVYPGRRCSSCTEVRLLHEFPILKRRKEFSSVCCFCVKKFVKTHGAT